MAEQVSSLLRVSADRLAEEVPASYRLIVDTLGPLIVELDIDDDRCTLRGGQRLHITDAGAADAGARISTTRATILDILDAAVTLDDAVESGTLLVQGALDDVLRAHDVLRAYVHAAVRAPSQPELIDALRRDAP